MADLIPNVAKGSFAYYVAASSSSPAGLVCLLLKSAGLEGTDVLNNYDSVQDILGVSGANVNDELNTGNYARKDTLGGGITGVTVVVNDTANTVTADCANIEWLNLTGSDQIGKLVLAYDANTGTGTDANLIPLSMHDFSISPDGSTLTASVANFAQAS